MRRTSRLEPVVLSGGAGRERGVRSHVRGGEHEAECGVSHWTPLFLDWRRDWRRRRSRNLEHDVGADDPLLLSACPSHQQPNSRSSLDSQSAVRIQHLIRAELRQSDTHSSLSQHTQSFLQLLHFPTHASSRSQRGLSHATDHILALTQILKLLVYLENIFCTGSSQSVTNCVPEQIVQSTSSRSKNTESYDKV